MSRPGPAASLAARDLLGEDDPRDHHAAAEKAGTCDRLTEDCDSADDRD